MECDESYQDDDEQPQGEESPPHKDSCEATGRLADAVSKAVSYHVEEYDLTAATVVGVLAIEAIRRALHAMRVKIGSEEEDFEDDDE